MNLILIFDAYFCKYSHHYLPLPLLPHFELYAAKNREVRREPWYLRVQIAVTSLSEHNPKMRFWLAPRSHDNDCICDIICIRATFAGTPSWLGDASQPLESFA